MANPIDTSLRTPPAEGNSVPERPPWMASNAAGKSPSRQSKKRRKSRQTNPLVAPVEDEGPLSWQRQGLGWLRSATAKGYGLSLFVHGLLLLTMALYVLPGLRIHNDITTVVQSDTEVPQEFEQLDDVELEVTAGQEQILQPQLTEVIEQDAQLDILEHEFLTDVTAAEAAGDGGSTSGAGGGVRMLEPQNAVRKGSFTAWTVPIPQRFGEKPKAGDSPRPGQAYYIAIQVKLRPGRKTYKVSDLTGKIIGTDGYVQVIPAMAYVQNRDGKIIRAKLGRLLPIVDGVAQILIKVPGADALVKDTIKVKSRSLKEEQTLELVFGE